MKKLKDIGGMQIKQIPANQLKAIKGGNGQNDNQSNQDTIIIQDIVDG